MNYASDFNNDTNDPRYRPVHFLQLIRNKDEYTRHKTEETEEYRLLSSFLYTIRACKNSEQILYELKMLGIEGVPRQNEEADFSETNRIWQLFLKKAYWRD